MIRRHANMKIARLALRSRNKQRASGQHGTSVLAVNPPRDYIGTSDMFSHRMILPGNACTME